MFKRKSRKKFHVSTQLVYMVGKKSIFKRIRLSRPYARRAVYRTSGTLLAL